MAADDPHLRRRTRLIRRFRQARIDALLVTCAENVRYLSGFRGQDSALLVASGRTALLTDGRYAEQAGQEVRGADILVRRKGLMSFAAQAARKTGIGRLGVEAAAMTLAQRETLDRDRGAMQIPPTCDLVERLRLVKDRSEIAALERAVEIAEEAFRLTLAGIAPGMTELQVAQSLDRTMADLGAEAPAFPTIVAAGERSALPHARPGPRKIRRNDAILLDWGARVNGYHCDLTRMVFLDTISGLFRRLYDAVLGAQRRGLARLRAGRRAGRIDASARVWLKAHRHGKHFTHGLGHGLGLVVHEAPALRPDSEEVLKPGMVCTVEPGVYLPGRGGVRIEDDVLITRTGRRVLTTLPKSCESFLLRSP